MNSFIFAVNSADLAKSLEVLWKGLLAIVVVVCIVMAVTALTVKISEAAEKRKKNADVEVDEDSTKPE